MTVGILFEPVCMYNKYIIYLISFDLEKIEHKSLKLKET